MSHLAPPQTWTSNGGMFPERASGLRVVVVGERRYASQLQPSGLIAALQGHDARVRAHFLEEDEPPDRVIRTLDGADVVAARGRSQAILEVLDAAQRLDLPVIDPSSSVRLAEDKGAMAAVFRAAGLPAPLTFVGPLPELARRIPATAYPVVVKPVFGDNGRDVHVVADRRQLRALPWSEPDALVQRYVPNDGTDLKIYCVGRHVWAVRKPSPLALDVGKAVPVEVTAQIRQMARTCAHRFGLSVFGIDCVGSADAPQVIEVNDFPNFTAVEDASTHLAQHVLCAVRGALVS